jgi:integrase
MMPAHVRPAGVTLDQLVEIWAQRLDQPKPQTIKAYRSIINQFIEYLGHSDAALVTDMDIVRWHEELVRPQTVTHDTFIKKHRAAISTIYAYSMTPKGRMSVIDLGLEPLARNPAAGLKLEGQGKIVSRPLSFSADEARSILRAALDAPSAANDYAAFNRNAQRWVPWICAYTGARAGEVCQLRRKDFVEIEGVKCLALLPDAGTIKTGRFRNVPLHPHLLQQGLWAFAAKSADGPLFYNPKLTSEQPWVQTVQMLGEWVRATAKVTDERISPNHAWRHWFKSKGRTAGIDDTYLDVICGQVLPTQGRKYGEFELSALLREIEKLPTIAVEKADAVTK